MSGSPDSTAVCLVADRVLSQSKELPSESLGGVRKFPKPQEDARLDLYTRTKGAIDENLSNKKIGPLSKNSSENRAPQYVRYISNPDTVGYNPKCPERIIKMVEKPVDPLELPRFRHRTTGGVKSDAMVPILRLPSKKLTKEEIEQWKIPPSISNWKNPKGYTIPLDKRVQVDSRNLIDISVNDRFAALSESLYIAEQNSREQIKLRNELLKQRRIREEAEREEKLRELAEASRMERSQLLRSADNPDARSNAVLEDVEVEHRREIERELRLERAGKRNKMLRDEDRDISERVALGQAQPTYSEVQYDTRLYNQSSGLDSGFEHETINVYDKPLFVNSDKSRGLYRFEENRVEENIGERIHVPSFSGSKDIAKTRTKPVEFERDNDDPFGLDNLIDKISKNSSTNI
ncbi:SKIP/SNW domain-containing protein [Cryptosporidium serpentis]